MRVFYAELVNRADRQDDEWRRIEAKDWPQAHAEYDRILDESRPRFDRGRLLTTAEFRSYDPEWWDLMNESAKKEKASKARRKKA